MVTASVFRSSAIMAAGTAVSRLLGFVRVAVLASAVGSTTAAGDAFDVANKAPNILYMLLIGGLLNAVLVPQIVSASKSADSGKAYLDRLITLSIVAMGGMTAVLTVAAPVVTWVYGSQLAPSTLTLAISFAYLCIPQVFFYGLYAVLGQILNAKDSYGPYMWAPVINNVIALVGLAAFIGWRGTYPGSGAQNPDQWTTDMVWLLAGSATIAVAAQALVLVPFMYQLGYRYKPAWGFRGMNFGSARSVASWTFLGLLVGQAVYALTAQVGSAARTAAETSGVPGLSEQTAGLFAYSQAFLLFMLPHSLVVVSLVTAMFTRLSRAVADNRLDDVTADTQRTVRVVAVVMALATLGLIVLRTPLAMMISGDPTSAPAVGWVVAAMGLGLTAFSINYALQRVVYAFKDGKTVFLTQIPNFAVMTVVNVTALFVVPERWMVPCVGLGMSLGNVVGVVTLWLVLRRRLPGLDTNNVITLLAQLTGVVLVVGASGVALVTWWDSWLTTRLGALGCLAAVGVYLVAAYAVGLQLLRVRELRDVVAVVRRRSR